MCKPAYQEKSVPFFPPFLNFIFVPQTVAVLVSSVNKTRLFPLTENGLKRGFSRYRV
jgi:hypothetical protein